MQSSPFDTQKPVAQGPAETSGKALASLALGLAAMFFSCFTAIPSLILAIVALVEIGKSNGRLTGSGLAIGGIVASLAMPVLSVALLWASLTFVDGGSKSGSRQTLNRLKQIGLGMHSYHDVQKSFPIVQSKAAAKSDLLSWRYDILPFLEEMPRYDEIRSARRDQYGRDLTQDILSNPEFIEPRPPVYDTSLVDPGPGTTVFTAPVDGPNVPQNVHVGLHADVVDEKLQRVRFADIKDGISNTVMMTLSEPSRAPTTWLHPGDLEIDWNDPTQGMFRLRDGSFLILFMDGSTRTVDADVDDETLRALLGRNDMLISDF